MPKPPVCVTVVEEADAIWRTQVELFPCFAGIMRDVPLFMFLNIYSTRELYIHSHWNSAGNDFYIFSKTSHIRAWRRVLCNAFWEALKDRTVSYILREELADMPWAEQGARRSSPSASLENRILTLPLPQMQHVNVFQSSISLLSCSLFSG